MREAFIGLPYRRAKTVYPNGGPYKSTQTADPNTSLIIRVVNFANYARSSISKTSPLMSGI